MALMMALASITREWRALHVSLDSSEQALIHAKMVQGRMRVNYEVWVEAQVEVSLQHGRSLGRRKRAREALNMYVSVNVYV